MGVGDWFYNRKDGKFLKSLYIVGRRVLMPLIYEDLPILRIPPFQNVVQPPLNVPVISNPTSTVLSAVMFL